MCRCGVEVGLYRLGVFNVQPLSLSWWLSRIVVVPFLLLIAIAIAIVVGRIDLRRLSSTRPSLGHRRGITASLLGTVGLGAVTVEGLRIAPLPLAGAVAVAAATRLAVAGHRIPDGEGASARVAPSGSVHLPGPLLPPSSNLPDPSEST